MPRDPHTPAIRRRPDGSIDTAAHMADGRRARSRFWRALARAILAGAAAGVAALARAATPTGPAGRRGGDGGARASR